MSKTKAVPTHPASLAMVPGEEHHDISTAKSESRVFSDSSAWKLDPRTIFSFLNGCEIDLFASRLSTQLPWYISCHPDPEALHTDALTMDWPLFKGYAFPPFNLIPAVLNKATQDKADILLVAPIWPAQPWWPLLLSLLVEHPDLLKDPGDPQRLHPIFPRLHLAVFHTTVPDNGNSRQRYRDSPFGIPTIYKENKSICLETLEWLVC